METKKRAETKERRGRRGEHAVGHWLESCRWHGRGMGMCDAQRRGIWSGRSCVRRRWYESRYLWLAVVFVMGMSSLSRTTSFFFFVILFTTALLLRSGYHGPWWYFTLQPSTTVHTQTHLVTLLGRNHHLLGLTTPPDDNNHHRMQPDEL